ncbi:MAG: hypothetical protein AAGF78_14855 [Pseudomonadota bacterium]
MSQSDRDHSEYFSPTFQLDRAAANLVRCISQGSGDAADTDLLKLAASLIEHVAYRAATYEGGNRTLALLDLSRQVDRVAATSQAVNQRAY